MNVTKVIIAVCLLLLTLAGIARAGSYENEVAGWTSYKDVAGWLEKNFTFDTSRQNRIIRRLREKGSAGFLARKPSKLFENSAGYCVDSANFAIHALNKIDPAYNARWVFIWNAEGRPHHWAAAFDHEGKLYVMDYGTGLNWEAMQGVHGPYGSLKDYRNFLASLNVPHFTVGEVGFREIPGEQD